MCLTVTKWVLFGWIQIWVTVRWTNPCGLLRLLGEGAAFLVPNLWADAIENDADGMLTFQEALKFFLPINHPDMEVRAAFMFDMYDKDDSGVISLSELATMIRESSPGSLVENDLLALSKLSQKGEGKQRKHNFLFEDYFECMKSVESSDAEYGVMGKCRKVLGIH